MKAQIKTKSNYNNLNGQWLEVKEIFGTRVTCFVDTPEYGRMSVDFTLKEVTAMEYNTNASTANIHPVMAAALAPFGI